MELTNIGFSGLDFYYDSKKRDESEELPGGNETKDNKVPEDKVETRGIDGSKEANGSDDSKQSTEDTGNGKEDSEEVKAQIAKLKKTEQEVIAHENAHRAAGGHLAGSVHYTYTKGPDGKTYITGGEVSIDVSEGKNPDETIEKMRQVRRAALAPAEPSSQDISVAAKATQKEQEAKIEKTQNEFNNDDEADLFVSSNDSTPESDSTSGSSDGSTNIGTANESTTGEKSLSNDNQESSEDDENTSSDSKEEYNSISNIAFKAYSFFFGDKEQDNAISIYA